MAREIPQYSIRPMKRKEIPDAFQLWQENGLHKEGMSLIDTWFSSDPDGFYVAISNDGMLLGTCAGVLQNENLAFIGLYFVKSEYRGHGIGKNIWNAVMKRVGNRNAGINTLPSLLEKYRDRSGFPVQTSWCSTIYHSKFMDSTANNLQIKVQQLKIDHTDILNNVISYDADVCGFTREKLVSFLCNQKDSITIVATTVDNSKICGYGNVVGNNIKNLAIVGPLYADSAEIAERILNELVRAFPTGEVEEVRVIGIDRNLAAVKMLDKVGFTPYKTNIARLYSKEEVHVKYEKIFSLHNLKVSVF